MLKSLVPCGGENSPISAKPNATDSDADNMSPDGCSSAGWQDAAVEVGTGHVGDALGLSAIKRKANDKQDDDGTEHQDWGHHLGGSCGIGIGGRSVGLVTPMITMAQAAMRATIAEQ